LLYDKEDAGHQAGLAEALAMGREDGELPGYSEALAEFLGT